MTKVLIFGPFEGVLGGVNIHINRLVQLLKNSSEVKLSGINDGRAVSLIYPNFRKLELKKIYKLIIQNDCFHINTSNWLLMIVYIVNGKIFNKKIIVTLHSWGYSELQKKFLKVFLKRCDKIISVNNSIRDELRIDNKIVVKHAFLPPTKLDEYPLPDTIISEIRKQKSKGKKIIASNSGQLFIYKSQDLYGLDLCIECARTFKSKKEPYFIIFLVSQSNELSSKYLQTINNEGLEEYILFYVGIASFPSLIIESDIILRPTNKDGDSITVREGIYYNKLVLASNVTKRPEGVKLFNNRDWKDLYNKIKSINPDKYNSIKVESRKIDFQLEYEELYKSI